MVKRTLETFECECGRPATRYLIQFPEGQLALDRCEVHEKPILKLKTEKDGIWLSKGSKATFKISTPEEIEHQRYQK